MPDDYEGYRTIRSSVDNWKRKIRVFADRAACLKRGVPRRVVDDQDVDIIGIQKLSGDSEDYFADAFSAL